MYSLDKNEKYLKKSNWIYKIEISWLNLHFKPLTQPTSHNQFHNSFNFSLKKLFSNNEIMKIPAKSIKRALFKREMGKIVDEKEKDEKKLKIVWGCEWGTKKK